MAKFYVTTEVDIRNEYFFEIEARDAAAAEDIAFELTADEVHSEAGYSTRIQTIQPADEEEESDD